MKRFMLFAPLALFVVLAGFFYYALEVRKEKPSDEIESVLIDKPFPEFELVSLDGRPLSRTDLVDGKVTLVNVWASWCPACRYEHPFLSGLVDQGVRIVGINYKDDDVDAKQWLNRFGDIYEFNIVDPEGRLGLDLGVYGAPETYMLDAEGIIRYKRVGVVDERNWAKMLPLYKQLVAEADNVED